MEEKEIIVVMPTLTNGGAERVLSELMGSWCNMGNKVTLVELKSKEDWEQYPVSADIERLFTKPRGKSLNVWRIRTVIQLVRLLRQRRDAVVVTFNNTAILILFICSFFVSNKIVFSERCDPNNFPVGALKRKVRDFLYRFADVCVFQTKAAQLCFPRAVQKKGVVIPNPINPALPEMFLGERRKTVVAACQLIARKNIPMMMDAFAKLSREHPDYKMEIYGRGDDEEKLRQRIGTLHMDEKILLQGYSNDVYSKMVDCALYVSSSNYEGISNSMLEALGMGIPTIATDCPIYGAREMIKSGCNGILVPVGDTEALYEAMKRVLDDSEFAAHLSEQAYKIRKELPVDIIARKWLKAFFE